MPRSSPASDPATSVIEETEASLEDLVRRLLPQVDGPVGNGDHHDETATAQEVLLGVKLDGVRYALVRRPPEPITPHVPLSPREREIVRLVANGLPNKAIAQVLDVSLWTVGTHLRRIFTKLGVSSRASMVAHVLEDGRLGH